MKPHELAEPLFQYVCRLNRSARKGGIIDPEQTRNDLKAQLAEIKSKATGAGPRVAAHFDKNRGKLDLALRCFIDHMVRSSKLNFAADWEDLAADEGITNGDERFFELLEETLREKGEDAADRLAVYYTCMGLGFTGGKDSRVLRQKMEECWSRLRGIWDVQSTARICPDAYDNVNTTNLVQPPGASLVGIAIALVGAIIVLFVANGFLYRSSSDELKTAVTGVVKHSPPAPIARPAPAAAAQK